MHTEEEARGMEMAGNLHWEFFMDKSYYDMWAVRPVGDRDFNSPRLFHFATREEAIAAADALSKARCAEPSPTGDGR